MRLNKHIGLDCGFIKSRPALCASIEGVYMGGASGRESHTFVLCAIDVTGKEFCSHVPQGCV